MDMFAEKIHKSPTIHPTMDTKYEYVEIPLCRWNVCCSHLSQSTSSIRPARDSGDAVCITKLEY